MNEILFDAAWNGDDKLVDECLANRTDVNFKGVTGWTPLHCAAWNGHKNTVDKIISHGGKTNIRDNNGETPLHCAARIGHTDIVATIISHGGDINGKDKNGWTPLHYAAEGGHKDTVAVILSLGGNVNSRTDMKWTPLHRAAGRGHKDIVSVIMSCGGDINCKDDDGNTPHDLATNEEIKKLLKTGGDKTNAGLPVELFEMDKESAGVFTDLLKEDSYELFELRSMLQGEQGTGKSTIARFLVGKRPTHFRMSTDGIELYIGLSFFDDETNDWIGGKQGFALEDITVSRSIKSFNTKSLSLQEMQEAMMKIDTQNKTRFERNDDISEDKCENQSLASLSAGKTETDLLRTQRHMPQLQQEIDMEITVTETMLTMEMQREMLETQSSQSIENIIFKGQEIKNLLIDEQVILENLNDKLDKLIAKLDNLDQISDQFYFGTIKKRKLIGKFKTFLGVKKEIEEIKISVTKTELFNKSRDVAKKEFHKRNIVPVTIWDFGGQDVFYSTHQTFLTYRAVYMLILDGSRTLNETCKYNQFLPGRDEAKTQKDYVRFWINTIITYCKGEIAGFPKIMVILTHKDKLKVTDIDRRRNEIFGAIEEMFDGSPVKQHLAIADRIFVNARN